VVVDRRALVANTGKSGYGIAIAKAKAAVRSHALVLAPRTRVNAVAAALAAEEAWPEI
jgi:hypothetical protein